MFKFIKYLNSKDYLLLVCLIGGGLAMLLFTKDNNIHHNVFSSDQQEYPSVIGSSGTSTSSGVIDSTSNGESGLGISVTPVSFVKMLADSIPYHIDTFKNIKWVVEYEYHNGDSTAVLHNVTRLYIIHIGQNWSYYNPHTGFTMDANNIQVFLSDKSIVLVH